jgi:hypothetical protein
MNIHAKIQYMNMHEGLKINTQHLTYRNFLQCNNAQILLLSNPLQRSTPNDPKEIYFIFF